MKKMRLFVVLACSVLLSTSLVAQKKGKQDKPPEIDLVEGAAHRQGSDILLDGKVRNCGDKPIKNLVILFHFLDADNQVITTRKGGVDEEVLSPGDQSEFHAQMEQPPRATYYRIEFEDGTGKYLRPAKPPAIKAIE